MAQFIFCFLVFLFLNINFHHLSDAKFKNVVVPNYGTARSGVTYSRLADDLPSAKEAIDLCSRKELFQYIRIYTPHTDTLNILKFSAMHVVLGVPNQDIINMAFKKNFANNWINKYVKPYKTSIYFTDIVVGHGIKPKDRLASAILPAMEALQQALLDSNDPDLRLIDVTTEFQLSWLAHSFPPSAGVFDPDVHFIVESILQFLRRNGPILFLDLYPSQEFANNPAYANISIDYALLSSENVIVQDGEFGYTNMLDGLIDAFYSAMEKIGLEYIWIHIGETGWPIFPVPDDYANAQNAETYVTNVFNRLKAGAISPKGKWAPRIFIYNLFFQSKAPLEQRNFGLFYPNKTATIPFVG